VHLMVLKLVMNFEMISPCFVLYAFPLCLFIGYNNLLHIVTSYGLIGQSTRIIRCWRVWKFILCYYIPPGPS
jgi:hypothetical protein